MKPLVNISLRSEYSFKKTFGKMDSIIQHENETGFLGIADFNNTFSHVYLEKLSKEKFKPIYGVRLEVIQDPLKRERGICGPIYIFIAKNEDGFHELNKLVTRSWEQFYYKPMLGWRDLQTVSNNVFIIPEGLETEDAHRVDYFALTPSTNPAYLELDYPKVYCNDNFFSSPDERKIYQLMAGSQKRGDEYYYKFETKRTFQHILNSEEFYRLYGMEEPIENSYTIAEACNVEIPRAEMVKYSGKNNIMDVCRRGAIKKRINLKEGEYADRYNKEMELIINKQYVDYFMNVWQMVEKAKKKMLVGPARGSAAGSLVCYLMGITEVDPIKFDLIFERFIDINREDLPDIDVDFPDISRGTVVKDLFRTHGKDNVCHISNVNSYGAKSAIDDVGIALRISKFEVDILKEAIVDTSGGDARDKFSIQDTLETTDVGKEFIEQYPAMKYAERIQGHATHAGKHAAGVVICNEDVTKYGAFNAREGSIMMDKNNAEYLNLLKVDVLGLRTLTILQECAELCGMDYRDYYNLPLDDKKAYKIFADMRLYGIFQFEGQAMRVLCDDMGIENFSDIVTISAIARPGPLHSGGASKFVKRRTGRAPTEYISDHPLYVENTKETYGIIVYQEQLMRICKDLGDLSWGDVSAIRKAASKTLGAHVFEPYKKAFIEGATKNGVKESIAIEIWDDMISFGAYAFNKSHSVSYGYISYWCAYMKAHYPLEFFVANLRHSKGTSQTIKILRDAYENEKIEYIPVDPDISEIDWTVKDGKLIGGLKSIKGIAEKKALEILECRAGNKRYTPGMMRLLLNPVTPHDSIYPCWDAWHQIYESSRDFGLAFPPNFINDIKGEGTYVVIGRIIRKEVKDFNEYSEVVKRGGKVYKDNSKSFKLTIEDDTGQINCNVNRYKFDKLRCSILNDDLIVDESWVIVRGNISAGWRVIHIENIFDLNKLTEE